MAGKDLCMRSEAKIKLLFGLGFIACSISIAQVSPIEPGDLHLIIDKPGTFVSSRPVYTQLNPGAFIVVYGFDLEEGEIFPNIYLQRPYFPDKGWKLGTSKQNYNVENISQNSSLIFSIHKKSGSNSNFFYKADFGESKEVYITETKSISGSVDLTVKNEDFIKFESEASAVLFQLISTSSKRSFTGGVPLMVLKFSMMLPLCAGTPKPWLLCWLRLAAAISP